MKMEYCGSHFDFTDIHTLCLSLSLSFIVMNMRGSEETAKIHIVGYSLHMTDNHYAYSN